MDTMIDLRGFNEVSESSGSYRKLPSGGYVCRILRVEVGERNNRPRIYVFVDIAEGEYAGYFKGQNREKWSNNAIFSRYIYEESGKRITPALKGLLTNVERLNVNFSLNLIGKFNVKNLEGKLCGFTFGEREYEYNGNIYTTTEIKFPVSAEKIRSGDFEVPSVQKYHETTGSASEGVDDNLPF